MTTSNDETITEADLADAMTITDAPRYRVPRTQRLLQTFPTTKTWPRIKPRIVTWDREEQTKDEVLPGLWIGNLTDADRVRDFDLTVNVSGVETRRSAHGEMHIDWPLSDSATLPEATKLLPLVRMIADVYRKDPTSLIFIHCAMGWNRSGIIMALVVRLIKQVPGREAVRIVRAARGSSALCNRTFEAYVNSRVRPRKGGR